MSFPWAPMSQPHQPVSYFIRPEPPVLLRGSLDTKGPAYELSVVDLLHEEEGDTSVALWYCGAPIDPDRLRTALKTALGQFPFLAGRLEKKGDQGVPYVDCNDLGALFKFIKASAKDDKTLIKQATSDQWPIPNLCTDKTQVQKYVDQVKSFEGATNNPNMPVCRIKLTVFDWAGTDFDSDESNLAMARPSCVLGVSVLAALLDNIGLAGFLELLSKHYNGLPVPREGSLDRVAPFRLILRDESGPPPNQKAPPIPVQVREQSLRTLWTKVKVGVTGIASAIFRLTQEDMVGLRRDGGVGVADTDLVVAYIWNLCCELRRALALEMESASMEDLLPLKTPTGPAKPEPPSTPRTPPKTNPLPGTSADKPAPAPTSPTPSKSDQASTSSTGNGQQRYTHLTMPVDFRGCKWLGPNYWGVGSMLCRLSLPAEDLMDKFNLGTVASLVSAARTTDSAYLQRGARWLADAQARGAKVEYNAGLLFNTGIYVAVMDEERLRNVVFGDSGLPLYANMPPRSVPWVFIIVPAPKSHQDVAVDLHVSVPHIAMEVLKTDLADRLMGDVAWG